MNVAYPFSRAVLNKFYLVVLFSTNLRGFYLE